LGSDAGADGPATLRDRGRAAFYHPDSGADIGAFLTLASNGSYSYTVAESAAAQLGTGGTKVDTFTVTSLDGTAKQVTFTAHGPGSANHVAVIGGVSTGSVTEDVESTAADPVPLHLRNAPTGLMKGLGYGKGYQYAHDVEGKVANMECLPESLRGKTYYQPTNEGIERRIRERLEEIKKRRTEAAQRTT